MNKKQEVQQPGGSLPRVLSICILNDELRDKTLGAQVLDQLVSDIVLGVEQQLVLGPVQSDRTVSGRLAAQLNVRALLYGLCLEFGFEMRSNMYTQLNDLWATDRLVFCFDQLSNDDSFIDSFE